MVKSVTLAGAGRRGAVARYCASQARPGLGDARQGGGRAPSTRACRAGAASIASP